MSDPIQNSKEVLKALGDQIRNLRIKKGWPQKVLAELSGISPKQIAQIERGELDLRLSALVAIAQAFNIDVSQLFRGIA